MLSDFSGAKIYLACGYTDLRRGIDGLATIIEKQFQLDPCSDALFMFCGRRTDRIKALYREGDGFLLLNKRLEKVSLNYSVPFEYIKKKVDFRVIKNTVEGFFDDNRICSHRRLYSRGNQYSTFEEHMSAETSKVCERNGDRFIKWAAKIGAPTRSVVTATLTCCKVEQQGYKVCMGIF